MTRVPGCGLNWTDVAAAFERDGALRDIHVFGAAAAHWDRVYAAISEKCIPRAFTVFEGDLEVPAPKTLADAFERCGILRVFLGPITVDGHFFTEGNIEFNVDPAEVRGQSDLDALIQFMRLIADATGLEAVLTLENSPEPRFVYFAVGTGTAPPLRGPLLSRR